MDDIKQAKLEKSCSQLFILHLPRIFMEQHTITKKQIGMLNEWKILQKSMDMEEMNNDHAHPLLHTRRNTLNFATFFSNSSTEPFQHPRLQTPTKGRSNIWHLRTTFFNPFTILQKIIKLIKFPNFLCTCIHQTKKMMK